MTPKDVAANSHRIVWWQCPKGHEYQATVASRNRGNGCPYCANKKVLAGYNDLATKNPGIAAQWHKTKNGDLTPKDVTANSHKRVWWQCPKGHEYQATANDRSRDFGCPYCANKKVLAGYNDLATKNPRIAAQWHKTKNGDLTPKDVTANSHKRVWWQCAKGHEWQATVEKRNYGNGCPYCSNQKVLAGYNDLATKNPRIAAQWHKTKNGDLTPKDVTAKSNRKVWWQCEKGHEWRTTVGCRSNNRSCPHCFGGKRYRGKYTYESQ